MNARSFLSLPMYNNPIAPAKKEIVKIMSNVSGKVQAKKWQPTPLPIQKSGFAARPFPTPVVQEAESQTIQAKESKGNPVAEAAPTQAVGGLLANVNRSLAGSSATEPAGTGMTVQAKLTIGAPGDKYEQEADRVAREVVQRLHAPQSPPIAPPPRGDGEDTSVQRQLAVPIMQRMSSVPAMGGSSGVFQADAGFEAQLQRSRGGGTPLDAAFRAKVEPMMDADFSGVRVHSDARADALSRSIQAKAFTTGKDMYFARDAYQPGRSGGQELLAHELTHVIQQDRGKVGAIGRIQMMTESDKFDVDKGLHIIGEDHKESKDRRDKEKEFLKDVLEKDDIQYLNEDEFLVNNINDLLNSNSSPVSGVSIYADNNVLRYLQIIGFVLLGIDKIKKDWPSEQEYNSSLNQSGFDLVTEFEKQLIKPENIDRLANKYISDDLERVIISAELPNFVTSLMQGDKRIPNLFFSNAKFDYPPDKPKKRWNQGIGKAEYHITIFTELETRLKQLRNHLIHVKGISSQKELMQMEHEEFYLNISYRRAMHMEKAMSLANLSEQNVIVWKIGDRHAQELKEYASDYPKVALMLRNTFNSLIDRYDKDKEKITQLRREKPKITQLDIRNQENSTCGGKCNLI